MNNKIASELADVLGTDEIGRASLRMAIQTPISASGEMVLRPGTPEGRAARDRLIEKHLVIPTGRTEPNTRGEFYLLDPRLHQLQGD
ncbi:MAG: hypothetical protein KW806_01160 [Candidatus Yanofskybacteria bacterium]|nr:hypothetical protein [Candidatus Yanofskybacteria bacterium]